MKSPSWIKNFFVFRHENISPQYVSASGSDTIGEFGDDSDSILIQNQFNFHLATKQESKHCERDDLLGNERRGFHGRDWIHWKSWSNEGTVGEISEIWRTCLWIHEVGASTWRVFVGGSLSFSASPDGRRQPPIIQWPYLQAQRRFDQNDTVSEFLLDESSTHRCSWTNRRKRSKILSYSVLSFNPTNVSR